MTSAEINELKKKKKFLINEFDGLAERAKSSEYLAQEKEKHDLLSKVLKIATALNIRISENQDTSKLSSVNQLFDTYDRTLALRESQLNKIKSHIEKNIHFLTTDKSKKEIADLFGRNPGESPELIYQSFLVFIDRLNDVNEGSLLNKVNEAIIQIGKRKSDFSESRKKFNRLSRFDIDAEYDSINAQLKQVESSLAEATTANSSEKTEDEPETEYDKLIIALKSKIETIMKFGMSLSKKDGYDNVLHLVENLQSQVKAFEQDVKDTGQIENSFKKFEESFRISLHSEDSLMNRHRSWGSMIKDVFLAVVTIGQYAKKNDSSFGVFSQTQSQSHIAGVESVVNKMKFDLQNLIKKEPSPGADASETETKSKGP